MDYIGLNINKKDLKRHLKNSLSPFYLYFIFYAINNIMSLIESERLQNDFNDESNNNECSICLDDINNGESIRKLDCGHVFHTNCVEQWINTYSTCPYCRQCETNIECYWLWLKPYNLSWINKRFKYKYTLKKGYLEIKRKKQVHTVNLYSVKHVRATRNIITFIFYSNKKLLLWFKDVYGPFNELCTQLDELARRRQQQREQNEHALQIQIQTLLLQQYQNTHEQNTDEQNTHELEFNQSNNSQENNGENGVWYV